MGRKPGDVKIVFAELSTPRISEQGYYNALLTNAVSLSEFRTFMGLPPEMPEDMSDNIKAAKLTQEITNPPDSVENKDKKLADGSPDLYPEYPNGLIFMEYNEEKLLTIENKIVAQFSNIFCAHIRKTSRLVFLKELLNNWRK